MPPINACTHEYIRPSCQESQGTTWVLVEGDEVGTGDKDQGYFQHPSGLRIPKPPSIILGPAHDPRDKGHLHLQTRGDPTCAHVCASPPVLPQFFQSLPPAEVLNLLLFPTSCTVGSRGPETPASSKRLHARGGRVQ